MPRARLAIKLSALCFGSLAIAAAPAHGQHDCGSATLVNTLPFTESPDTAAAPQSSGAGSCNSGAAIAADLLDNALWYRMAPATDTPVRITVTGIGYDTLATLWTGPDCSSLTELACRDQPQPNVIRTVLRGGSSYWLSVGDFGTIPGGGPTTVLIELDPAPLLNDTCSGATTVDVLPVAAAIDTMGASATAPAGTCNSAGAQQEGVLDASVWYTFTPAETMNVVIGVTPDSPWDPLLLLLRGTACGALTQVTCRDLAGPGEGETLQRTLIGGTRYWIVIGDHGTFDGGGPGLLTIATPPGACCMPGDSCTVTSGADCAAAGGLFQGEGSACAAPVYVAAPAPCPAFEDISASGTVLPLGEDDGAVVPIGFDFPFFGESHGQVGVSANGYLCFAGPLDDFSNDPIPAAAAPNALIAPLWEDFSPHLGGSVQHELRGSPGLDLRLIVQWTGVPRFQQTDSNTFQAVLFESGRIDFRYDSITPEPFPGAYTAGVENADGTAGLSLRPAGFGAGGTCVSIVSEMVGVSCAELCPCEFDGLAGVNVFDLLSYLTEWFAGGARADLDGVPGVDVFDLLAMLDCWMAASAGSPCP